MASPQIEDGYVKIANELQEAFGRTRIPGEARQVLDVIIRKTYGFRKIEDAISLSQFVLATGLTKSVICRSIGKLRRMNIINNKVNGIAIIYRINKDFETWKPLAKRLMTKESLAKRFITINKKVKKYKQNRVPQKKVTKETITKDIHTAETSSAGVVAVIDAFEEVNPTAFKKWYRNKTQRSSAYQLVKIHGEEKVLKVIGLLPKVRGKPYFPSITTPNQLEDKWAALETAFIRLKNEPTTGRGIA